MTTMILIRHGESEANRKGFFAGQIDAPLTDKGTQQALLTAEYIAEKYKIDKIYASDLKRAYETGKALGKLVNSEVLPNKNLREINAGLWQGMEFDDLIKTYKDEYNVWLTDIGSACPPDGETVKAFSERIKEEITKIAEENEGKTVVIATHATPIRVMQTLIQTGDIKEMKNVPWVTNASFTEIKYNEGTFQIVKLSEDKHLKELKTEFSSNV